MSKQDTGTGEDNGCNRLQEILEKNGVLLSQMNSRSQIKKVIIEAAVDHFSKLSPEEQLETVAEYLEKFK
jgi:hypothetical protein